MGELMTPNSSCGLGLDSRSAASKERWRKWDWGSKCCLTCCKTERNLLFESLWDWFFCWCWFRRVAAYLLPWLLSGLLSTHTNTAFPHTQKSWGLARHTLCLLNAPLIRSRARQTLISTLAGANKRSDVCVYPRLNRQRSCLDRSAKAWQSGKREWDEKGWRGTQGARQEPACLSVIYPRLPMATATCAKREKVIEQRAWGGE